MIGHPLVLLLADEHSDRRLIRTILERDLSGVVVTEASSRARFEKVLDVATYDLVITSHELADLNALEVIDELRRRGQRAPVILLVGTGSEAIAIEAMKRGASDYVIHRKPYVTRLSLTVEHFVAAARLARTVEPDRDAECSASGIAHDLNNSLLAIFGYGELAREDLLESTAARRNLDEVLRAAERARQLVTEILADGSRRPAAPSPGDAVPNVRDALLGASAPFPDQKTSRSRPEITRPG